MLKIGITGGIGSGKTTVCKLFAALNIPIYYADDRAKWLMTNSPLLKSQIQTIFGSEAYLKNGQLNRPHIGQLAFNNTSLLQELNQAVHPIVFEDSAKWMKQQKTPYAIKEAALFYETGSYTQMDKMITVTAPEKIRIERVVKRDKTTPEAVKNRMDKQMSDKEKIAKADFVIYNTPDRLLTPQILTIHRQLINEG